MDQNQFNLLSYNLLLVKKN